VPLSINPNLSLPKCRPSDVPAGVVGVNVVGFTNEDVVSLIILTLLLTLFTSVCNDCVASLIEFKAL